MRVGEVTHGGGGSGPAHAAHAALYTLHKRPCKRCTISEHRTFYHHDGDLPRESSMNGRRKSSQKTIVADTSSTPSSAIITRVESAMAGLAVVLCDDMNWAWVWGGLSAAHVCGLISRLSARADQREGAAMMCRPSTMLNPRCSGFNGLLQVK